MPPRCAGRRRRSPSPERPANDELDEILEEERVAAARGERKIIKNKKLHTADAVQNARKRIYKKTATAKKTATSKKVKALEVLKAELEVEVKELKELKARKAVMPGSAVFHS